MWARHHNSRSPKTQWSETVVVQSLKLRRGPRQRSPLSVRWLHKFLFPTLHYKKIYMYPTSHKKCCLIFYSFIQTKYTKSSSNIISVKHIVQFLNFILMLHIYKMYMLSLKITFKIIFFLISCQKPKYYHIQKIYYSLWNKKPRRGDNLKSCININRTHNVYV